MPLSSYVFTISTEFILTEIFSSITRTCICLILIYLTNGYLGFYMPLPPSVFTISIEFILTLPTVIRDSILHWICFDRKYSRITRPCVFQILLYLASRYNGFYILHSTSVFIFFTLFFFLPKLFQYNSHSFYTKYYYFLRTDIMGSTCSCQLPSRHSPLNLLYRNCSCITRNRVWQLLFSLAYRENYFLHATVNFFLHILFCIHSDLNYSCIIRTCARQVFLHLAYSYECYFVLPSSLSPLNFLLSINLKCKMLLVICSVINFLS